MSCIVHHHHVSCEAFLAIQASYLNIAQDYDIYYIVHNNTGIVLQHCMLPQQYSEMTADC